jgi:ATP-dependent DNA ligase
MRVHEHSNGTPDRYAGSLGDLPLSLSFAPMEAKLVDSLPEGSRWQFEPKWDGFRCLAFRAGADVELRAKSGKGLGRYFPEVIEFLQAVPVERFVLDGELLIPQDDALAFDALQMRLHPAESRIRKLAQQTPAMLMLFDCLVTTDGISLVDRPLIERRSALEALFKRFRRERSLRLSPYTRKRAEAQRWLERSGGALDGVVAKPLEGRYLSGERAMLKVKRMRTVDCVVGGFRYAKDSKLVGSLLLGLYNEEGKLDHVGFTSSIAHSERPQLTKQLEALVGGPGFTGDAPGGPSRWSTERSSEWQPLKTKLVVEVCYDHISNRRFRHGTRLLRWRPDKSPEQCTFEQLESALEPGKLARDLMRGA